MGIMDGFRARKAMLAHQRGQYKNALALYAQVYDGGYVSASYMLPYSVLLLREGGEENYRKVKEVLKKAEKASDMTDDRRQQLLVNYAVAQYKLGELDKAIHLLEASHRKFPCGGTYGALGFFYIEAGDAEKALAYNREAVEYDEEDPVTLDNLGQTYYRLLNDREKAREYFEKALQYKPGQIDTLYFLAQYDLEEGKKDAALEKLEKALEGRFSPLNYVTKEQLQAAADALKE